MPSDWGFLTNHGRVLLCIAEDPGVRLRDIADQLGFTERTAFGIVDDLVDSGYVVKKKDGRRNRYQVQRHVPLRDKVTRERTVGEVLSVLTEPLAPESTRRSSSATVELDPVR
jgi:DNA-binding IclR family transcriptional regulator